MSTHRETSTPTRPNGFALPAAIFGLVVVGVLVTGGFYIARQETRIGIANRQATEAFYLAERGMYDVVEDWNAGTFSGQADWTQTLFADTVDEGTWEVEVTKMSAFTYLLDATSTITRGGEEMAGATRRMGMVAKISTANIDPPAALTTRGAVSVRGGALVNGFDANPSGWTQCPAANDDRTGVLTDLDGSAGTDGGGQILGDPPSDQSGDITDETFRVFGEFTWEDLVDLATWRFPEGNFNNIFPSFNADGSCNYSDPSNWGDPFDPTSGCGLYFPVVYVGGGYMRVQSGGGVAGQGILLVEGDLDIRGDFVYHGIIITQGNFETQGGGNKRVMGAVLASNADIDLEKLTGQSVVQYSSCAVTQALVNNANLTSVKPLAQRSWVDLTNLSN